MKNIKDNSDQIFRAIESTLKKIRRLNSTILTIKTTNEPDELSISSLERIKLQLTKDLASLLATFDIEIKIGAKAA